MDFIRRFILLFHDLTYYRHLLFQSIGKSLLTLFLFYLALSSAVAAFVYFYYVPKLENYSQELAKLAINQYPSDMKVSINNGEISLENVATPSSVTLPTFPGTSDKLTIYLDPQLQNSELSTAPGQINIGKNGLRVQLGPSEPKFIESFNELVNQPLTFTGNDLHENLNYNTQVLRKYSWTIPLLIITIGAPVLFLARVISALLFALMLFFIGPLFTRPFPYRSFLNLILHIHMVVDTIMLLILMIYQQSFPYLYQIALIGVTLAIFFSLPKVQKIKLEK